MKLKELIIGVVIFGIIIVGYSTIASDLTEKYDINDSDTSNFSATYDKLDEMHNRTEEMEETVTTEGGFLTTAYSILVKGTWKVVQLIGLSLSTVKTMIKDMSVAFGLPAWFGTAIIAIIVITIVSLILSIVWQREI